MNRHRTLGRLIPYLPPVMVIAVGVAFLARGLTVPEYAVPNGRDLLFNNSWQQKELTSGNTGQLVQQWESLHDSIATRHYMYVDVACSLLGLGSSVLAILIGNKVRGTDDFRQMITPRSRGQFYLYASVVWLSFVPLQLFYLNYIDAREDPPFVDNMAIPIESGLAVLLGLVGLPVILFGVWVVTRCRRLPVALWSRPSAGTISLTTTAVWIALVLSGVVTVGCLIAEPPLVPSCVFTVYLLLCGRAVSASPATTSVARGFDVVQHVQKGRN